MKCPRESVIWWKDSCHIFSVTVADLSGAPEAAAYPVPSKAQVSDFSDGSWAGLSAVSWAKPFIARNSATEMNGNIDRILLSHSRRSNRPSMDVHDCHVKEIQESREDRGNRR